MDPLVTKPTGRRRQAQAQPKIRFDGNQAAVLSTAMKLAGRLPHELNRDDIMDAAQYEGNTLGNTITEVFVT